MTDVGGPDVPRQSETMEIVTTVVAALNGVITALRQEIESIAATEKRRGRRLTVYLAMLGIVMAASLVGVGLNYNQGNDVKEIVNYIEECQKPGTECSNRSNEQIGRAVASISGAVFDGLACVEQAQIVDRTDELIASCRAQHVGVTR